MTKKIEKIWQKLGSNERQRRRNVFILFVLVLGLLTYAITVVAYGFKTGGVHVEILKHFAGQQ